MGSRCFTIVVARLKFLPRKERFTLPRVLLLRELDPRT
jgi:hypothetical protein